MAPPRSTRAQQDPTEAPPSEVLDAMRVYADAHQIQQVLQNMLVRLLEAQPLDPYEFLIKVAREDAELDALELKAKTNRFDLRRESTKKSLVVAFYKRLVALQRTQHEGIEPSPNNALATPFLLSQLRLEETREHLKAHFPKHYRDLIHWFFAHEKELPGSIAVDTLVKSCFAAPARAMPARPLRAADQGPFDWLVPFIPPFLRVNRDTREQIWAAIVQATSPNALKGVAKRLAELFRAHGKRIAVVLSVGTLWLSGLKWVQANVHELAVTYVIVSAFVALGVHIFSGDATTATDINGEKLSAYSVFNEGARRMMGSLSAEQFENEIRHRLPRYEDQDELPLPRREDAVSEEEEEDDPDFLEALQQSLEEKKREERRARRTQRRR